jgi:hypothetical protein
VLLPEGAGNIISAEGVGTNSNSMVGVESDRVLQEDAMVLPLDHTQVQPGNAIVPVGQTNPSQVRGNLHIGMALLPYSIDFDPVYESFFENRGFNSLTPKQNAESIRLWENFLLKAALMASRFHKCGEIS